MAQVALNSHQRMHLSLTLTFQTFLGQLSLKVRIYVTLLKSNLLQNLLRLRTLRSKTVQIRPAESKPKFFNFCNIVNIFVCEFAKE